MRRLTERERQLSFILVVLVMFTVTFKFGFLDVTEKSREVEIANMKLSEELNTLNILIAKKDEYKAMTEDFKEKSAVIKKEYGPGNSPEKTIMFFDTIENITGMKITQLSFGEMYPVVIPITEETIEEGEVIGVEGATEEAEEVKKDTAKGAYLYCTPVTAVYVSSYDSLKDAIAIIGKCPERMTVESLNASFDTGTGKLAGTISLNMYEMTGTDKSYRPPIITDVPTGKPLPFGVQ